MVLAERNSDPVRNGRRSRGPSPNSHAGAGAAGGAGTGNITSGGNSGGGGTNSSTHNAHNSGPATISGPGVGTPESSDDDNSIKRNGKSKSKQSEYEEKIRVGRDYQAVCPPLIADLERKPELLNERALLVWSPTKEIPDTKLEEYIAVAKEKYGYNGEQALGMLFWHKHDLERAVMDLSNFTPFPDEWTVEDKVLFDQAFQFHGKSFHRIRQMLPDKSIASLVKYYYSWKKTRHRTSAMDRQEKVVKAVVKEGSENGSELGSNEESDADDKIQANKQKIELLDKECNELKVNVDDIPALEPQRITARWTNDEMQFAALAMRDYGKDFQTIAKLMGTKTESHLRTFYMNNRRRMNLDQILKEYEAKQATTEAANSAEVIITSADDPNFGGGVAAPAVAGGVVIVNEQLPRNAADNVHATATSAGIAGHTSGGSGGGNTAKSNSSLLLPSPATAPGVEQKRHHDAGRQKEQANSALEAATTSTAAAAAAAAATRTGHGQGHSSNASNSSKNHTALVAKLDKDKIIIVADESDTNTTTTSSCSDSTMNVSKSSMNEDSFKSSTGVSSNSNAKRDNTAMQSKNEQLLLQPMTKRLALSGGVHSTDGQTMIVDK